MSGLREAMDMAAGWASQGVGQGGDFANLYMPRKGDVVFFHFLTTGNPGDPYFETYVSHEYPSQVPGRRFEMKVCPVRSGLDPNANCPGCAGGTKLKQRMAVWLFIEYIFRKEVRQGETLEMVGYNNEAYYYQPVNEPKLWETSAWRDSCLSDILMNYNLLASQGLNLQSSQFAMNVVGQDLDRRYKPYPIPGSPALSAEQWGASAPKLKSIKDWLREKAMAVATVAAPLPPPPLGAVPGTAAPLAFAPPPPAFTPPPPAAALPSAAPAGFVPPPPPAALPPPPAAALPPPPLPAAPPLPFVPPGTALAAPPPFILPTATVPPPPAPPPFPPPVAAPAAMPQIPPGAKALF